jgi:DNA (cytosine-5)-methyltransferase 1
MLSVDLFSGAGGFTEGLTQVGFSCALASDVDEMASKTFRFNHPTVPFLLGDIREFSEDCILEASGLKPGELNLLVGGPPCQGFSLAGRRILDDPRNRLFLEYVRVVKALKPEVFIFENVSGITSMEKGRVVSAIVDAFQTIGYSCEYAVLNAADFGVPQSRSRFILIGSPRGKSIGFPHPTHQPPQAQESLFNDNRPSYLSAWTALSDLPYIEQGEGAEEMVHSGDYHTQYQRDRRGVRKPGTIYNHRATGHSAPIIERYAAIPEGGDNSQVPDHLRTKKINVFKIDSSRPSRTVTCNHRTDLLHPKIPRGTTVREAARLQSFDDDYCFFGNLTRKAKWVTQDDQVGNAVPPLLARALGQHVKSEMGW